MYVIMEQQLYADGRIYESIKTTTVRFKTAVKIINDMDPFVLHHRKIDDSVYIMDEDIINYDMIGGIGFLLRDVVFESEENKEIFQIRYFLRKTGIKF